LATIFTVGYWQPPAALLTLAVRLGCYAITQSATGAANISVKMAANIDAVSAIYLAASFGNVTF
jgi:hypothetical protein